MNCTEVPAAELIPHAGRMLLLDRVLSHDETTSTARVVVGGQPWLQRRDGSVPPWLALEYMAQCVAAHEGLLARAEGRPASRGYYLVSARALTLYRGHLDAGAVLRVRARRVRGRTGLGCFVYACELHAERDELGHELIARGQLSVASTRAAPF